MGCLLHSLSLLVSALGTAGVPYSPGTPRWWAQRKAQPQNREGGPVSKEEPALPSLPPPLPPTNRKSAAGFHGDVAGLVGWTGRQGWDRGKSRFLRGSQPSAPDM